MKRGPLNMAFRYLGIAKYNYNNQVKEDRLGRACSNHARREINVEFCGKARRKETIGMM
jgi:hypothetical protein